MALSQQPGSIMLTLSKGQVPPFLSWFLLLSWDVGDSFCLSSIMLTLSKGQSEYI
eukprot:CAMPEP_0174300524 /NCGR_PEP_ID=MMETSP0809-20121228/58507_1 /TAXON_ID=73025 ORGANISM="Eutreptiella gymnastica-like, Strain CCMP1594" /NCGR_SAMPLE_ID=MMETSP0809 /ASSEMBLY_ACC=CAM_ASM_000658 /LENGTH=54 /DNA_ID=CAMNT_0015406105 /DNA_START=279 /DNA_END=443 /DNA_ORIENTATION=+